MFKHISQAYNFTFTLLEPPNGFWGGLTKDGRYFDGMTGAVSTAQGDIGLGDFFQVLNRMIAADFLIYGRGWTTLIVPPSREIPTWKSVATIFDFASWMCILASMLLLVIVWRVTRILEKDKTGKSSGKQSERMIWPDIVAQGLASVMRKVEYTEEPLILKLAINGWIIVGFFFAGVFFRCILIQKMTNVEFDDPVESASQLTQRNIPVQVSEMSRLIDRVFPQFGIAKIMDQRLTSDYGAAIAYIAKGGSAAVFAPVSAALYEKRTRFWEDLQEKPLYHVIKSELYLSSNVGWIVHRHAFFGELLQEAIITCNEMGLTLKWYNDLILMKRRELKTERTEQVARTAGQPSQGNAAPQLGV